MWIRPGSPDGSGGDGGTGGGAGGGEPRGTGSLPGGRRGPGPGREPDNELPASGGEDTGQDRHRTEREHLPVGVVEERQGRDLGGIAGNHRDRRRSQNGAAEQSGAEDGEDGQEQERLERQ